ncbi:MAG: T9SS type A sorting domain-containing protein [Bacteroidetes bacterium]|nr:T9SS type A sorting domain-containing protein [Bacteroidota bacterium]
MNIRKVLFGIGLLISVIGQSQAQTWAPVGAKWTYTLSFAFSPDVDTLVIRSVGDTVIQGKHCRILHKSMAVCDLRGPDEYMYSDSGRVYFYDASRAEFQMLFDINAQIADSWIWHVRDVPFQDSVIVKVDSVSTIIINAIACKEIFVEYLNVTSPWSTTGSGRIIENIGDEYYLFPWVFGACDGAFGGPLRCCDDNLIGHFETGVVSDCNYRSVGMNENSKPEPGISIYPNPASNQVSVEFKEARALLFRKIEIYNLFGTKLFSGSFPSRKYTIDTKKFPAGLYILRINADGMEYNYRLSILK